MICTRKIENLPIDATPNNYKQLLQITRVTGQWLQPTSITPFAATFQTPYLFFFSRFLRRPRASPFFFLARSFTPFLSLAACSLSRQNSFIAVRRRSGSSFPLDSFQLDVGTLVEEENPFYVVRKGDIVGVYKTFSECQHQLSSSVFDPAVSVYKGYSLSEESEEYLTSHGLKNAVYSINSRDLKEDLFGSLVPCPIQIDK
ncbi:hypothetical protein Taro_019872 [Colocasia esculenta]|uniref:Ribonuclease H1 N-terminal domain-containing protein n=1 Tax=Colocasia esculenta TaxID=4460 RepID=A0A843V6T8_COLES|nr:hypothetical protein [Colocasia esculenta]